MGLYLCVFASDTNDEELDGVEVGGYDDFGELRQVICDQLEGGRWGSQFPVLMNHRDSDGDWAEHELPRLREELQEIGAELAVIPAPPYLPGWQASLARQLGHRPANYSDYFIDVDGENLLERLTALTELAIQASRPVTFM